MIVSHKTRNPLDSSVKFVTFIDAMLSLVVTQMFENPGTIARGTIRPVLASSHPSALIIGLWMLLRRKYRYANLTDEPIDVEGRAGAWWLSVCSGYPNPVQCRGRSGLKSISNTFSDEKESMAQKAPCSGR